jgi:uncharacterized protein YdeI (YjbR/CyaY-like superfamily)
MAKKHPGIDAYIAKSAPFARPILRHLRRVVHAGCPGVEETLKWGMPSFTHKGILCGMAAFKAHATFGFWKGKLVVGSRRPGPSGEKAMGQFGRITSIADLPGERRLIAMVKRAAALNEQGVRVSRRPPVKRARRIAVPPDLAAALRKHRKALATFEGFSPSHRREYVEWLTAAKRPETRARRLETAIAWLAEGKPHNWRYVRR